MKKEYKYYYIYRITCLCEPYIGYYYLGKHKTNNLNDGYTGSSHWLSVNYWPIYGKIENVTFKKEILFYFNNQLELDLAEHAVIGKNFITDDMCINEQQGGSGGFGGKPWNKGINGYKIKKSGPRSDEAKKNIAEAIKTKWQDEEYRKKCSDAASNRESNFKGHKHSEKSLQLMRDKKTGKIQSEETKMKRRKSLLGHPGANTGKHRVYREDGTFYYSK